MNVNYKLSKEEILFYIYFAIITVGKGIGLNADNPVLRLLTIIAFISLAVKLVISNFTYKEFMFCFVLGGIGLASYYVTKREGVLLSIITLIGLKNVDYKRLFSVAFIIRLVTFISVISLALLGIIENKIFIHWRENYGEVYRYALGFDHPNLLHTNFFILVILFIYINYEKLNIIKYIIILAMNYSIYNYSVSRTGFYSVICIVLVTLILKNRKSIHSKVYKIFLLVIPFCVIFTVLTALAYNKFNIINKLDSLFSGRIYYSNYFFDRYSLNLLGHNLSSETNLLDNGYVILLVNYGMLIFALYMVSYYKIIKIFINFKMNKELLIISFFSIYGITEGYIPNIFLNLSLVFIANLIFLSNNEVRRI